MHPFLGLQAFQSFNRSCHFRHSKSCKWQTSFNMCGSNYLREKIKANRSRTWHWGTCLLCLMRVSNVLHCCAVLCVLCYAALCCTLCSTAALQRRKAAQQRQRAAQESPCAAEEPPKRRKVDARSRPGLPQRIRQPTKKQSFTRFRAGVVLNLKVE